jgi:hypothetical protein
MYKPIIKQGRAHYKFDVHVESLGRIRRTVPDTGQSKRELQCIESDLYRELEARALKKRSCSLTFADAIEHYCSVRDPKRHQGTLDNLKRWLGKFALPNLETPDQEAHFMADKFYHEFLGTLERKSQKRDWSQSTHQAYKRYGRAVCGLMTKREIPMHRRAKLNPLDGIEIGKTVFRKRPIAQDERERLEKAIMEHHPWLWPAYDWSRKIPTRPGDLFNLTIDHLQEGFLDGSSTPLFGGWTLRYLPQKTGKTGVYAEPVILPEFEEHFRNRPDNGCPYLFWRPNRYSGKAERCIVIKKVWADILEKAKIEDLQWYDLRHDAVSFLRSKMLPEHMIMRFAGWSTSAMLDGYDPGDRERDNRVALELLAEKEPEQRKEVANG